MCDWLKRLVSEKTCVDEDVKPLYSFTHPNHLPALFPNQYVILSPHPNCQRRSRTISRPISNSIAKSTIYTSINVTLIQHRDFADQPLSADRQIEEYRHTDLCNVLQFFDTADCVAGMVTMVPGSWYARGGDWSIWAPAW